jgi:hypothetical protein
MEHKGVEYSIVQIVDGSGWWEVRFGSGKNKSGVTPLGDVDTYRIHKTMAARVTMAR